MAARQHYEAAALELTRLTIEGRLIEALQLVNDLEEIGPEADPEGWIRRRLLIDRASIVEAQGDLEGAIRFVEKMLEQGPSVSEELQARLGLAKLFDRARRPDAALRELEKSLILGRQLDEDIIPLLVEVAEVCTQLGRSIPRRHRELLDEWWGAPGLTEPIDASLEILIKTAATERTEAVGRMRELQRSLGYKQPAPGARQEIEAFIAREPIAFYRRRAAALLARVDEQLERMSRSQGS